MKVVLQRVTEASVTIDGREVGRIGKGYCLLVGFTDGDTSDDVVWMAAKVAGLRLFSDEDGKMNLALADVGGAVLVVSQFTLYGDVRKGRRPSFVSAARPETAIPLYQEFLGALRGLGLTVACGEFPTKTVAGNAGHSRSGPARRHFRNQPSTRNPGGVCRASGCREGRRRTW